MPAEVIILISSCNSSYEGWRFADFDRSRVLVSISSRKSSLFSDLRLPSAGFLFTSLSLNSSKELLLALLFPFFTFSRLVQRPIRRVWFCVTHWNDYVYFRANHFSSLRNRPEADLFAIESTDDDVKGTHYVIHSTPFLESTTISERAILTFSASLYNYVKFSCPTNHGARYPTNPSNISEHNMAGTCLNTAQPLSTQIHSRFPFYMTYQYYFYDPWFYI